MYIHNLKKKSKEREGRKESGRKWKKGKMASGSFQIAKWLFPDFRPGAATLFSEEGTYLVPSTDVLHLTATFIAFHFTDTGKHNIAFVIKIIFDSKMVTVPRKFQSRDTKHFNRETALHTNSTLLFFLFNSEPDCGSISEQKAGRGLENTLKDTERCNWLGESVRDSLEEREGAAIEWKPGELAPGAVCRHWIMNCTS